jgi:hypothetical protein
VGVEDEPQGRLELLRRYREGHVGEPLEQRRQRDARLHPGQRRAQAIVQGSAPRGRSRYYPRYHCIVCKTAKTGGPISERVEVVHQQFYQLLLRIRPREETLKLFRETLVRRWNQELREERSVRQQIDRQINEQEGRLSRVIDLYIDQRLTHQQKETQLARLEHQLIELRAARADMMTSESDKDVTIAYALNFMENLSKLWTDMAPEQRLHFLRLVFPDGLAYGFGKGWWNPTLGLAFEIINDKRGDESHLVAPSDNTWLQLKQYLRSLADFMRQREDHAGSVA